MATPDTALPDESASARARPAERRPRRQVRWAAYAWGVVVLVSLIVAAPLALGSIGRQLIAPPANRVYTFSPGAPASGTSTTPADASYFNVAVAGLDEAKKAATLRISGHRACAADCPAFKLLLFSLADGPDERAGLPPSATVTVAEGAQVLSESVELPVSGLPSLYPFDHYTLNLAGLTVPADSTSAAGAPDPLYTGSLTITLDSELSRLIMLPPNSIHPPARLETDSQPAFQRVVALRFVRPLHLQVLTCLLVSLIAAAALLSVSTEPLRRLLVGVGSIVLSVWGVRQILIADAPPAITAVDLLLSGVILILLYGIAIRVLLELRRGGWDSVLRLIRDE
ncbi:MAG TPA: hypothetical protein VK066_03795 [Chloroflexota bacterium]|nr:hypothetical protein [Chloroflexota bacterium]